MIDCECILSFQFDYKNKSVTSGVASPKNLGG